MSSESEEYYSDEDDVVSNTTSGKQNKKNGFKYTNAKNTAILVFHKDAQAVAASTLAVAQLPVVAIAALAM